MRLEIRNDGDRVKVTLCDSICGDESHFLLSPEEAEWLASQITSYGYLVSGALIKAATTPGSQFVADSGEATWRCS